MRAIVFLFFIAILSTGEGDECTHKYVEGEFVELWMNTLSPYNNKQETYDYYSLPFCSGKKILIDGHHNNLGETLQGVNLQFSGLVMEFKIQMPRTVYCNIYLHEEHVQVFSRAVKNHFWYQMYMDDLPLWGIVGQSDEDGRKYIWTHKKFEIGYNENRIVEVNLTVENNVELKANKDVAFTFEVIWTKSDIPFEKRFDKFLDAKFFENSIRWYSVFNSLVMIISLMGILARLLFKSLKNNYSLYSSEDDKEGILKEYVEERGWQQIHREVFRPPSKPMFFSTLLGIGYQLIFVTVNVIILAIAGELYAKRSALLNTTLVMYGISSPINGYFGSALYTKMGGKFWIRQFLLSALLLPVLVCAMTHLFNIIAIYYYSSRMIPFASMTMLMAMCFFIVLPLTFIGVFLRRCFDKKLNPPCIDSNPRPIPKKKWYLEPVFLIIMGGIIPFGSIFVEMYFIFVSFWTYKIYYVYGFMLLEFVILILMILCVSMLCTFFLLNAEDYRWQWTSFMTSGMTAVYVYLYSIYFFFNRTNMYGLFQTIFYFGYMALYCILLGIVCGTLGFIGSCAFVSKIYSKVKTKGVFTVSEKANEIKYYKIPLMTEKF